MLGHLSGGWRSFHGVVTRPCGVTRYHGIETRCYSLLPMALLAAGRHVTPLLRYSADKALGVTAKWCEAGGGSGLGPLEVTSWFSL